MFCRSQVPTKEHCTIKIAEHTVLARHKLIFNAQKYVQRAYTCQIQKQEKLSPNILFIGCYKISLLNM
jgi:hypothetical protein